MKLSALFLSVLVIAVIRVSSEEDRICPKPETISPCSCDREGISCFRLENVEQFANIFRAPSPKKAAKAVWLNGTPLKKVMSNTFNGYMLGKVFLDKNQIETVEQGSFAGSERTLSTISVYDNKLTSFPYSDLIKFPMLSELSLAMNRLQDIPSGAFRGHPGMTKIILRDNIISSLGSNAFENCPNLAAVDLAKNSLTSLGKEAFKMTTSGASPLVINLGDNKISRIHTTAFAETDMQVLNLTSNSLRTLDPRVFVPIAQKMLKAGGGAILVGDNLFTCNGCDEWEWVVDNKAPLRQLFHDTFQCKDGTTLAGLSKVKIGCRSSGWFGGRK